MFFRGFPGLCLKFCFCVALLCRFLKKSGKNKGIHCRFACFASKKIKSGLQFF
tara:strand:- start:30 stop:188 length:159 start_codon:yes stop_codon:yes gene_type:complete